MTHRFSPASRPAFLLVLLLLASPAAADAERVDAAASGLRRSTIQVVPPGLAGRPTYLRQERDPTYGTVVERVTGEPGAPLDRLPGNWGQDARHTYSKQQPWNSDQSLLVVENRKGGSPNKVILDGGLYLPRSTPCVQSALWEYRWHPSPQHPHEMIAVNKEGTELTWFDVTTCTRTRRWPLPIAVQGIGEGEGNPSNDGRFIALGNSEGMFVVDMDPQPPARPWPHVRIGPLYSFPPCSLEVGDSDACKVDNLSISSSGRYVVVKYGTRVDSTEDGQRVYAVDPVTLALSPQPMSGLALRCGSFEARPNGWIFPLKHPDLALDPDDHNEDIIVGGRSCPGSTLGHVVKVRLRDGRVTSLTDPKNEAAVFHVSTRNVQRPGWAYVTYYRQPGRRFSDEIVSVRTDGSGQVERWTRTHSLTKGCYRCEPQGVPSPDGRRVMFASNWAVDCDPSCGDPADIKDYVVAAPDVSRPPDAAVVSDPRGHGHRKPPHSPRRRGSRWNR